MRFDITKMAPKIKGQTFFLKVMFLYKYFRASYVKLGQNWCLKCFDLRKSAQHEKKCSRVFFFLRSFSLECFRAGLGKFGKKSFAPPKICLLLHLCSKLLIPRDSHTTTYHKVRYKTLMS